MTDIKRCRYCKCFVYEPHDIISVMTGDLVAQFDGFCRSPLNCVADCPRGPSVMASDRCVNFQERDYSKDQKRVC